LRTATIFNLNNFLQLKSACARLCVALILFFAVGATAQTNTLSDAEIQGRQLAQQLCDAKPTENLTDTGVLKIRDSQGITTNLTVKFEIIVTQTNWQSIYTAIFSDTATCKLFDITKVVHFTGLKNQYEQGRFFDYISHGFHGPRGQGSEALSDEQSMTPFAGSDFWVADLGLEFFHWPEQKVLPKTANLKRGRDYTLLESTNPNPSTNGYSRVLSWIDKETGGILEAEAYDADGKLLKEFAPKSFKKINGQWELQEMEIRNVQTGSRTRLEFDLQK
jgi:hypothetical protein